MSVYRVPVPQLSVSEQLAIAAENAERAAAAIRRKIPVWEASGVDAETIAAARKCAEESDAAAVACRSCPLYPR